MDDDLQLNELSENEIRTILRANVLFTKSDLEQELLRRQNYDWDENFKEGQCFYYSSYGSPNRFAVAKVIGQDRQKDRIRLQFIIFEPTDHYMYVDTATENLWYFGDKYSNNRMPISETLYDAICDKHDQFVSAKLKLYDDAIAECKTMLDQSQLQSQS